MSAGIVGGRDGIVKTSITITVLHRVDNTLGDDIEEVLYEIREGEAVGRETDRTIEPVPADLVSDELVALGNDGTFFDDDEACGDDY